MLAIIILVLISVLLAKTFGLKRVFHFIWSLLKQVWNGTALVEKKPEPSQPTTKE